MNKTIEYIRNYISERKFEILGEDDNHLAFKYQLNNIYVFFNEEVEDFVSFTLSNFDKVTEENFSEIIMRCHNLTRQLMQVKFYTIDETVIASYEFHFLDEDDLEFQIETALDCLINAKVQYKTFDL